MNVASLSRYPALRLLVPLAAGIIVAECAGTSIGTALAVITAGIITYLAISLWARDPSRRLAMRPWWIAPIALIALGTGMFTTVVNQPRTLDLNAVNGQAAEAVIDDVQRKDFSMTLTATMLQPQRVRLLITTRGCDYTLHEGDHIRFMAHLSPIINMGNPDEPDYATVMRRKGIIYQQHLDQKPFHTPASQTSFTPMRLRHLMEDAVLNADLSESSQQLLIAMILGDSRLIDPDRRQAFSRAGVAHVLALSGLHVGVIAWMVWLLLFPLDYWRLKKLRLAITMLALAAFCVLTGLSPSVMRATLMIAMAMCSYIFFRRYPPLNSLAVAALAILIFAPQQLFGAGFQLSFITVTALLLTGSHIKFPSRYRVVNYIAGTLATTLVATLSTFMLTAYYFHTISLASLPANLLVLPLVPIIIGMGTLVLALAMMGLQCGPINQLTDFSCSILDSVNQAMSNLHIASIDNVYVGSATLALYMLALMLAGWWLFNRKRAILLAASATLLATIATHLIASWATPHSGLVIFNDFKSTPVLGFSQGHAILWIPDYDDEPTELLAQFQSRHKTFLAHQRIQDIGLVSNTDTITPYSVAVKPPFATMGGMRIMVIDSKTTATMLKHRLPPLDIVILGRHFKEKHLAGARIPAPQIVTSGASRTPPGIVQAGTPIHHLATDGAYVRFIND